MPRYATIITADDGAEIVSAIGEFEGASLPRHNGRVEQVAPGVRIGMVRAGPVEAVAGFGFPRPGLDHSAIAAATATLKAAAPAPKLSLSPQVGEMSGPPSAAAAQLPRRTGRTGAVPPALPMAAPDEVHRDPPPKPARVKRRKKPARKSAKARAVRSAKTSATADG
ncbi:MULTISPECIES: hypothetical protein [unclassified Mesorhizobium]|uniref:hypothetical protein n=1 Tax=unclassified Mesorhizobium TaxID=325217 RepID=UPI000FCBEA4A|nr:MULTISPECIES: hypothetical protein [unclassified Mesorhizobium]TGP17969.1 hypothetical protein EN874_031620 [Mesorhizobium sp. M1D.F.Ca.ET.231.01.1.1]TGP24615.1 hypothetical protein EN877_31160 [Mesorhizobium sp. M1D.F.Ca.ET.234.01.1.1]TGS36914.1 hypothetical protein EN827_31620 [Mesorhizobium sp. M1D.F.Ca.ET.184.01.1.1]TGS57984.1 hypothetical protein EN826_031590 [Mesorhizobium sp. M1D.F.Ca.ET.183.01.1.1]